MLLLLPTLGLGGFGALLWQQRQQSTSAGRAPERKRDAKRALSAAKRAAAEGDAKEAEEALRGFLTARLDRHGSAIGPGDAGSAWSAGGGDSAAAEALGALLGRCEAVRYGDGDAAGLADAILRWLEGVR